MESASPVKLVECPRDAMQGWKTLIPTQQKIAYINSLLQVGFHTLDCGSFVSPKAIPQMADTAEVLKGLNLDGSATKLLVIVANTRGAEMAVQFDEVTYMGFPFSISPTFQQRNTNSTIEESLLRVEGIQRLCATYHKQLVVYLSMGFGNPYGDAYNQDILLQWADEMVKRDVAILSLADTVGLATTPQITLALNTLIAEYPKVETGVHLHSTPANWQQKMEAAVDANCRRFDGALKGIGGCPMANDHLVGNMNTEWIIDFFEQRNIPTLVNRQALQEALMIAGDTFI